MKSITFRFASSTFLRSNLIYIDVTSDPILCPNASDMVSFGMSSPAAIVAQVWRLQYDESSGNKGVRTFFPPLPVRSAFHSSYLL